MAAGRVDEERLRVIFGLETPGGKLQGPVVRDSASPPGSQSSKGESS